jgi:DNA repair protein RadC
MYQNQPIKQWVLEDRPREKMMKRGMGALTDSELIALLLGTGYKKASAVDLSKQILQGVNNDLDLVARMNCEDLCKIKGIGKAKAMLLMATFELGRRRRLVANREIIINCSEKTHQYFKPILADLNIEEFHVLLLNQRNKLIKSVKISQGGISSTSVDVRLIFKAALDFYATKIILVHNHPSGNLTPSLQDNEITSRIVDLGKMIEINVLDHLIITNNGYFSYADKNLL